MRTMIDQNLLRIQNYANQKLHPEIKIFVIGFNKTGTRTIYKFLRRNGITAVHWKYDNKYIAIEIFKRISNPIELKTFMHQWTAFSDLTFVDKNELIEANAYFREFYNAYPKSYFILNDRDMNRWIESRRRHSNGDFLARYMAHKGCNEKEVFLEWENLYRSHKQAVLEFFKDHDRFLHFRIDEDPVDNLIEFLSPHFTLKRKYWEHRGKTKNKGCPQSGNYKTREEISSIR